jgi:cysteine desulfurase
VDDDGRTFLDADGHAPLHPAAREALDAALDEGWADPRRLHTEARRAGLLLAGAREAFAEVIGCRTEEVHLAPNHTVSLHTAVHVVARGRRRTGDGVVLSAVERSALHAASRHVASAGPVVVPVDGLARVDVDRWSEAVALPGVAVAALQHSNGEVGTLQPLAEAHAACRAAGVPLVVDAGAAGGHVELGQAWDLLALDPGGWGAPQGVAVLAVRSRTRTATVGPEDEDAWFPGGPNLPAAFAAAVGLRAVLAERVDADVHRRAIVDRLRTRIAAEVPDVQVVGDPVDRLPHVVTFSCLYVDGEALVGELDRLGFAVGSGSACTSSALEPSHVLAAMGVLTHGNVRLTLPVGTTEEEIDRFCDVLPGAVATVRAMIGASGL